MVVFQKPNKEILITLLGFGIAHFSTGDIHAIALSIGITAGIIWSYMEISTGINTFRKALGWVVLLYLFITLFQLL